MNWFRRTWIYQLWLVLRWIDRASNEGCGYLEKIER
jgi:hypothetical protein